jgi:mRNA-degrading endonuclease toxin of MazEF toxin-antitoxin module
LAAAIEDLERGSVCLALYPFALGFPLQQLIADSGDELLARVEAHPDIDSIEKTIEAGDVPRVATQIKLRRVLLLQNGANRSRQDIMVARISHVSPELRARQNWYARLRAGVHPTTMLLDQSRHGVTREAYVNTMTIASIGKNAILRRVGALSEDEMRGVSGRLVTALELDISSFLS